MADSVTAVALGTGVFLMRRSAGAAGCVVRFWICDALLERLCMTTYPDFVVFGASGVVTELGVVLHNLVKFVPSARVAKRSDEVQIFHAGDKVLWLVLGSIGGKNAEGPEPCGETRNLIFLSTGERPFRRRLDLAPFLYRSADAQMGHGSGGVDLQIR